MVTAGVYLIARTHVLFALSPAAMAIVAIVGAATLLLAGLTALTQADIKRVLAYSTVSQIGYMFLGLGVGAWSAAMFHFMIHAFFKSLLFLGAGAVILAMHHEQDMFRMGGLRKRLPAVFWTFLIGCGSLAAIPLVTGGFYSKDAILSAAWTSEAGHPLLYLAGLLGAFLTSVYTFRMVFLTFFGEPKHGEIAHKARLAILIPLVVLAVLATLGGFLNTPATLGRFEPFSDILRSVFPEVPEGSLATEWTLQIIAMLASLGGVYAAYVYFLRSPQRTESLMARPAVARLHRFWFSGWGFDWLYDRLFVRPILWVARANRDDIIDSFYDALARINWVAHLVLVQTQTGHVRWYAVGIVIGAIIILGIVVL
jgi:NADH-quinone oxidoreductase subunit L